MSKYTVTIIDSDTKETVDVIENIPSLCKAHEEGKEEVFYRSKFRNAEYIVTIDPLNKNAYFEGYTTGLNGIVAVNPFPKNTDDFEEWHCGYLDGFDDYTKLLSDQPLSYWDQWESALSKLHISDVTWGILLFSFVIFLVCVTT